MLRMNTSSSRGVRLHPHAVAENRAAGERAGRIDGDRRRPSLPSARSCGDQPIDQRALAGAGRPGDADEIGAAGVGEELPDRDRRRPAPRLRSARSRGRSRADRRRRDASGRRRGARESASLGEQLAGDDEPLNLARAFADRRAASRRGSISRPDSPSRTRSRRESARSRRRLAPRSRWRTAWPSTTRGSCGTPLSFSQAAR